MSGKFFAQFSKRNQAVCKQFGLYKFKNVKHGIICVICINSKEYFELCRIYYETNKKRKDVRKGTKDMDFDSYASHILTNKEAEEGSRRFAKKQKQNHFQNKKGNMVMVAIEV